MVWGEEQNLVRTPTQYNVEVIKDITSQNTQIGRVNIEEGCKLALNAGNSAIIARQSERRDQKFERCAPANTDQTRIR